MPSPASATTSSRARCSACRRVRLGEERLGDVHARSHPMPPGRIVSGRGALQGPRPPDACRRRSFRSIRGGEMAMIFQDPMTSLNPVLTIGYQIAEAIRTHNPAVGRRRGARRARSSCSRSSASRTPSSASTSTRTSSRAACASAAMIAMAIANSPIDPDRRRADDGARRDDPGADHRGAADRAARDARRDDPDHARPRA